MTDTKTTQKKTIQKKTNKFAAPSVPVTSPEEPPAVEEVSKAAAPKTQETRVQNRRRN